MAASCAVGPRAPGTTGRRRLLEMRSTRQVHEKNHRVNENKLRPLKWWRRGELKQNRIGLIVGIRGSGKSTVASSILKLPHFDPAYSWIPKHGAGRQGAGGLFPLAKGSESDAGGASLRLRWPSWIKRTSYKCLRSCVQCAILGI